VSSVLAAVIYVAPGAAGSNNGTTWADAYTNLQTAITNSASGDQIWVKAGTYVPASEPNRTTPTYDARYYHFHLKNGVTLYGGFAGDETVLDQRDISRNATILSGGGTKFNVIYHTWNWSPIHINNTAVLDGFTVSGATNSAVFLEDNSATIRNCTFTGNNGGIGAAINNKPSSTHTYIEGCTFNNNTTAGWGGAMYNNGYYGKKVYITNCTFRSNSGGSGGAIFNAYGASIVMNSTFSANTATNGRAIYNDYSAGSTMTNSILWDGGSEIYNTATGGITVSYSVVTGGFTGTGNTDADPKFDAAGLRNNGGPVQTIAISRSGSAFDAGTGTGAPATDARGIDRPQYDFVDMGAYESSIPSVIYVDSQAGGTNDGSSWTNAYTDLQTAITAARFEENNIWVAAGTYKPQTSVPGTAPEQLLNGVVREYHFSLKNGVGIYGGFSGTENSLADRDVMANQTVLSGDIGIESDPADNCYHVLYHPSSTNLDASAILDGFTITAGNADGIDVHSSGGGMYNNASSPTVTNCTFFENSAAMYGGGMYNEAASPSVTNCTFDNNSAGTDAGGMLNADAADPQVINTTFTGNTAGSNGGAMLNAICAPTVTNCTFTGNTAGSNGGGMYNASALPVVVNSIFWNNGTEIDDDSGADATVTYSVIQGGWSGTGSNNSAADPLLDDGGLKDNGGSVATVAIGKTGSAFDAGTAINAPATDARGVTRPQFSGYDIGAFEMRPEDLTSSFPWNMFLPAIMHSAR
jgi:hypothetical protein